MPSPAAPAAVNAAPLSTRAPQPISAAAIIGSPSALFSGTKKPPARNHSPITTRLKMANARIATAGKSAIAATPRIASAKGSPRRHRVHVAATSALIVTGQAS